MKQQARHRVVVVGAGFGGLYAARALKRAPVDVTLINSTNHHIFEPLIYQVAAGILSPGEVAVSVREAVRRQRNCEFVLGTVTDVDPLARTVAVRAGNGTSVYELPYDTLIVAAGASQSYFGHDEFAPYAPGLKSIDDALEIRGRVFGAFEMAELASNSAERAHWLTFAVVGGGPTGVEMAGQIAEIAHRALPGQYRRIDPRQARIVLLDAVDRVLPTFDPRLSAKAERRLRAIGVDVRLGARVVGLDALGVTYETADGIRSLDAMTKIWAAGVSGTGLAARLAAATGAPTDRVGRILVEPDLTVPGHPEIFVLGEAMSLDHLPGVAQVAIQGGRYAGRRIAHRLTGARAGTSFSYYDKGNLAAVSRFFAIADLGRVRLAGVTGWLIWHGVHVWYLYGLRNKSTVLLRWALSFLGRSRSEAVITAQQVAARTALRQRARAGEPV
ncbi:NAD(P)/FAD-dependent oxidoreductase [Micromonospora sp. PLK6-60]|uniref:NAD(P)/FAD-dependent oxidoreductase n=1 Tax=Micromonospora sp. PLK6-60 TaxID=2873383 RepID=UPI001CA65B07|nr:NAD(P)/FAD-dependent oxidoreductase [Micromonospora sp. PLK6-60]MBY8870559.1 NAD(P)/FAD-dependent oxidoreductase [Micromonospora sp. PLK6-60]